MKTGDTDILNKLSDIFIILGHNLAVITPFIISKLGEFFRFFLLFQPILFFLFRNNQLSATIRKTIDRIKKKVEPICSQISGSRESEK